jgi:hypothetical protein
VSVSLIALSSVPRANAPRRRADLIPASVRLDTPARAGARLMRAVGTHRAARSVHDTASKLAYAAVFGDPPRGLG